MQCMVNPSLDARFCKLPFYRPGIIRNVIHCMLMKFISLHAELVRFPERRSEKRHKRLVAKFVQYRQPCEEDDRLTQSVTWKCHASNLSPVLDNAKAHSKAQALLISGAAMASCSCSSRVFAIASPTSQSSLIYPSSSSCRVSLSTAFLRTQPLRTSAVSVTPLSSRWSVRCSAAGMSGSEESPYVVLGVSALEKFEVVKGAYSRKRKEAEKKGDDATVERLDKAYDRLMMMQLSNRKQGLAFGGQFAVSKEIKYADKRSWIPWGPKRAVSERRDVLINLAISALFSAWIVAVGGQAGWKPLQFLIFGYIFRIFTKLGEFEPTAAPSFETEDEEEGGGSREDTSRRLRNGKRLLRTLGLVFSCVAVASIAYTGTLNAYEYAVQYVPRALMGAQEAFVTGVTAVGLFIMASFYR